MRLWRCPRCNLGRRAPGRLNDDDMRKVCVPCSQATGRVVRLIVPAVVNAKQARAEVERARRARAKEREAQRADLLSRLWPGLRRRRLEAFGLARYVEKLPAARGTVAHTYLTDFRVAVKQYMRGPRTLAVDVVPRKLGVPRSIIVGNGDIVDWTAVWSLVQERWRTWLLGDIGIEDANACQAVLRVADPLDVETFNNVVRNALVLAGRIPEGT